MFPADTILFEQGDMADAAYLVQKGCIEISIDADTGTGGGDSRKILSDITDGGVVGEMALISNQPRMARARAKTETTCVVVPHAVFDSILDKSDAFTRALILSLIGHIRSQHKDSPHGNESPTAAPLVEDVAADGDGSGAQFFTPQRDGGYRQKG